MDKLKTGHKLGLIKKYNRSQNGEMALDMAIYFTIFSVGAALLLPTLLEKSITNLATNDQGVDRVITGSVKTNPVRHRIIKSVIAPEAQRACLNLKAKNC